MRWIVCSLLLCAMPLSAQEITCIWDLAALDPQAYDGIFAKTITPQVNDFRGQRFNGFILHVADKELGAMVYKMYTGKSLDFLSGGLTAQTMTFQKRFYLADNEQGESGINFWPVKGKESMPMRIYLSPCLSDPGCDSLKIDYEVEANDPLTEQILIDEVRQIPYSNLYLGKMYYRLLGEAHFFLWFVLERR